MLVCSHILSLYSSLLSLSLSLSLSSFFIANLQLAVLGAQQLQVRGKLADLIRTCHAISTHAQPIITSLSAHHK